MTEDWSTGFGPYNPVLKDNKLYGRGGVKTGWALCSILGIIKAM